MSTWVAGFQPVVISNKLPPRRPQLGRGHRRNVTKIVLHTTEGSTAASAFAAYRARAGNLVGGIHPHFTVDPKTGGRFQHVPLDRASYSLRRFDQEGVVQIEIVGFADQTHEWPAAWLHWLGANAIAPVIRVHTGIVRGGRIDFPEFLGKADGLLAAPHPRGKARVSADEFHQRTGILGHQHATFDDHWDPGRLDVATIAAAALRELHNHHADPTEEDDMYLAKDTTENRAWIVAGGKARELERPDDFDFDGPVRSAANMRFVIEDLFDVAVPGPGVEDPPTV